jgi:hypothetical protein
MRRVAHLLKAAGLESVCECMCVCVCVFVCLFVCLLSLCVCVWEGGLNLFKAAGLEGGGARGLVLLSQLDLPV